MSLQPGSGAPFSSRGALLATTLTLLALPDLTSEHALAAPGTNQATPPAERADKTAPHRQHAAPPPRAAASEAITVVADTRRPRLARSIDNGALGSRSELETPFSVRSVGAAQLQSRQVTDISGAFAFDPSVILANSGVGAASGSSFKVRGLPVDELNGYKLDGLAIPYWSIDLPPENFDQIQLLKGATAFMYGFGAPGGIVNFQLKQPTDYRLFEAEAGWRSDTLFRETVDAGGPIDTAGVARVRLSAANEEGGVFNGGTMRRDSLSAAADVRLTPSLSWNLSLFYMNTEQDNMINTVSVAQTVTSLPTISGRTQLGAEGSEKANDMKVLTSGMHWDISDQWHSDLRYRFAQLDEDFPGALLTFLDNRDDYRTNAFFIEREWWYNQVQDITEGHVRTGPFAHDLVFGVGWEDQHYDTDRNATTNIVTSTGNIFASTPTLGSHTPALFYSPSLYNYIDYTQISPFLSDTIDWQRWSLLGGVRYTNYREVDYLPSGAASGTHNNNPVTPVVSLSYRVAPRTRVYFSYVKAMQSGGQAAATNVNYNAVFAPIESSEYEVGVKTQQRRWSATASFFRMDTGAAYTNSQNVYVEDGVSRYQGFETSGGLEISPALTLDAGFSYLDAQYVQTAASYQGHRIEGTPRWQAEAQLNYNVPFAKGLGLYAAVRYVGSMFDNAANTLLLPDYTTADLGASYATRLDRRRVTFRAMVRNLADRRYWITYGNTDVLPGDPRTVTLSVSVQL